MERVYECHSSKRKELNAILSADPYASDSFARVGYVIREGSVLSENKESIYLYIKADDSFIKKADEIMKDIATILTGENEKRIIAKILAEEENAESGFGSLFG